MNWEKYDSVARGVKINGKLPPVDLKFVYIL